MNDVDFSELSFVVAEDGAYMRTIIRNMLQGFGCRKINEAEDGAAALELIERVMPDIVLLDWVMPVLDGSDVMRMIRQPEHPMAYVPVIMVTSYTERKRIMEARQLGVHEVLSSHYLLKLFRNVFARSFCNRVRSLMKAAILDQSRVKSFQTALLHLRHCGQKSRQKHNKFLK